MSRLATAAARCTMFAAVFCLLGSIAVAGPYAPGRVLVKFRDNVSPERERAVRAALGADVAVTIPRTGIRVLRLPPRTGVLEAARSLSARADVVFAEPDWRVAPDATPNDPYFARQWHLPAISAPSAWDTTTGSSSVIIAILDTGVDSTHGDLAPKIVAGRNTFDNNDNTADVHGHGTAVAGAAAGCTNNGSGVSAPAWGCRLMPMRVTDTAGYGYSSAMAAALTWAADHGARVANISFKMSASSTVTTAAQYFNSKGGVVTIAAGNDATFTATADNPSVLTVTATQTGDALASFTSTGNNTDISAPGVTIYSTTRGGGYGGWSGTSFAAPVAAGVAALVISAKPSLTALQVMDVLKQTADDKGPAGWDAGYGWGRVNAARAVAAVAGPADTTPPDVAFIAPVAETIVRGSVIVQTTASDNHAVRSVALLVDGVDAGSRAAAPYEFAWDSTKASNGTHSLQAIATDEAGNSRAATVSVTVTNPDIVAPTIRILSPRQGASVCGCVSVDVSTADNVGVTSVTLMVDGAVVASASAAPWKLTWDAGRAAAGAHLLAVVATDAGGNTARAETGVTVTVSRSGTGVAS